MNEFERREEESYSLARYQSLAVLIWGPGDPGENGDDEARQRYAKRCLIREVLREHFPRSTIRFSEEIKKRNSFTTQLDQERNDAYNADAVIILGMSRGTDLELDHLIVHSWFRKKVWLLIPQQRLASPGLADEVYKLIPENQRSGFTPEEYERSDVAKVMSVNALDAVANTKLT